VVLSETPPAVTFRKTTLDRPSSHRVVGGIVALVVGVLMLVACDTGRVASPPTRAPTASAAFTPGDDVSCTTVGGKELGPDGPSANAVVLQEKDGGKLAVEAVVYPHPDYHGNPWSQWGQGLVVQDGRFISAIGDHLGADGNSYLYEYSPDEQRMTLVTDVLSLVEHADGDWGYGKIHSQMVTGPCGEIYFSTYWGTRQGLEFSDTYNGDVLFRLDPELRSIVQLGTPLPEFGIPSLASWPSRGLLYGEAVDPRFEQDRGPFFVYDVVQQEVIHRDDDASHGGFRNVAVDGEGRAYFSLGDGVLGKYDPATNQVRRHPQRIPGSTLRASTSPDDQGVVYGVTQDPDVLFAIEPDGKLRTIGPVSGYTASIARHPDGEHVLYVPAAHGGAWEQGAPLVSVNLESGTEQVLVRLNDLTEEKLGLRLGGTYNVAVDTTRRIVYVGMNAGTLDAEDAFGEAVLLVVHLP
jgi:hypothetical protein